MKAFGERGGRESMNKKAKKRARPSYLRLDCNERAKVLTPRGFVPMLVGKEKDLEKFLLQTQLLNHPYIRAMLEMAAQEFGYEQQGILKIPCEIEHFQRLINAISTS